MAQSKSSRRRAKQRGQQGEAHVARKWTPVFGDVEPRKRENWGEEQSDLTTDHTPYVPEVKKRGGKEPWPVFLEAALTQARKYVEMRVDPAVGLVVLVNSPGPGVKQEERVYMDHDDWLEKCDETVQLYHALDQIVAACQPLVLAIATSDGDGEVRLSDEDVERFMHSFEVVSVDVH